MDSRRQALLEIDERLARAPLRDEDCAALPGLAALVPGRVRQVTQALSAARSGPAVDGLLALPPGSSGMIEGVFAGLANGAQRPVARGVAPHVLAMDFRHSRARSFPELLDAAAKNVHGGVERLDVDGALTYRFTLDPLAAARDLPRLDTALRWLQPRLSKLKRTRLWINGWCFTGERVPKTAHRHLVQAWLTWVAGRGHDARMPG